MNEETIREIRDFLSGAVSVLDHFLGESEEYSDTIKQIEED